MSIRILEAYDDGYFPYYFKARRGLTYIAGVEVEDAYIPRRVAIGVVRVDGGDTHKVIREMSSSMEGDVILLDGVIYAGFDVVDPHDLHNSTGKGVVVIQLFPLHLERIKRALQEHFDDWSERFSIISSVYNKMIRVETPWRLIEVYSVGLEFREVLGVLRETCIYSPNPEPLRIADKIASAISRLYVYRLY